MKKKFIILLLVISNLLVASEAIIYKVHSNNSLEPLAKITLENNDIKHVGVSVINDKIYLDLLTNGFKTIIYDENGKIITKSKNGNECVSIGPNKTIYRQQQIYNENTSKYTYNLSKKDFNEKQWEYIDSSIANSINMFDKDTVIKQINNLQDHTTTYLTRKTNSSIWKKKSKLNKLVYMTCPPVDNSFLVTESATSDGKAKFYKVTDNSYEYLGNVNMGNVEITDYIKYNNEPSFIYSQGKRIFKVSSDKHELIVDMSKNDKIDYLSLIDKSLYAIKIIK